MLVCLAWYYLMKFYQFSDYFCSLIFYKLVLVVIWFSFKFLLFFIMLFSYSHLTTIFFSSLYGLLLIFFIQMDQIKIQLISFSNLNTQNLKYIAMRKKFINNFTYFVQINNTYGNLFLSSIIVFCPINANMSLWVLQTGIKHNLFTLFLVINQFLLIFVSHLFLTKCSFKIHANFRPLLSIIVISKLKTENFREHLKMAHDVCVFHCKKYALILIITSF